MNLLDPVIFYTHETSDTDHNTRDEAALVTRVVDENTIDVVVFPPGGPIRFVRVSRFLPNAPVYVSGGSYWREANSEAPDFGEHFAYANDPRWIALRRRQTTELTAVYTSNERDEMLARHLDEQRKLNETIAKEQPPKKDPHR